MSCIDSVAIRMSVPSKSNLASLSEADLASGTESPTKPGVYWFQSRTMVRALIMEVRIMNGELTVRWTTKDKPVARLLVRRDRSLIWTREPLDTRTGISLVWAGSRKPSLEIQPFPAYSSCAVVHLPPTIRLPARSLCPSRFVPSVASPCCAVTYSAGPIQGYVSLLT